MIDVALSSTRYPVNSEVLRSTATKGFPIATLIREGGLRAHFQPIVDFRSGEVYGHEALIRGPAGSVLERPDVLLEAAKVEDILIEFEIECVRQALWSWSRQRASGKLFLNFSAEALIEAVRGSGKDTVSSLLGRLAILPTNIVIELTEHERVSDLEALMAATKYLRSKGCELALDDFGDGRSSLRLWSELRPGVVKIDKYFVKEIDRNPNKLQTVRALQQIAETFGSRLLAEGVEEETELRAIRELGIEFGQGWLFGRPQAEVRVNLPEAASTALMSKQVAVLPEPRAAAASHITAESLLVEAPALPQETSNNQVYEVFEHFSQLHALAVVNDDQCPVALIDRATFIGTYARPYFRELYGKKPCLDFAERAPLLVDVETSVEKLTEVLTTGDQRYLRQGFVLVSDGRYRGLGTGEALVKAVTESRIEAARHANPLTFLPGNIPITRHITNLVEAEAEFVAAYVDLDHFKPFNDLYGYWRGDDMLRLASRCLAAHLDPQKDFLGHVGGDDFVILFQSRDWQKRCLAIVQSFNEQAREMFDEEAQARGGIQAEDRFGVERFHPCTTMCIGAVPVDAGAEVRAEDVASCAAQAKRVAKARKLGLYVMEIPMDESNSEALSAAHLFPSTKF